MPEKQPKTIIRTIWQGEAGRRSHRVYVEIDGMGTCFTVFRNTLYFATRSPRPEQAYLLKIDLTTQQTSVIYQTDHPIRGVTQGDASKLLLIVSHRSGDRLVILSPEGRILQEVAIGERREGSKALWVPAAPPLWMRLLDEQTLLIYSYGGQGDLLAFSLQGQLRRKWQGVTGVAFDAEKKRLYVSGAISGSTFQRVKPSKDMRNSAWRLVGVDAHARFYWYRETDNHRSWLACADSRQTRWIVPLGGAGGVLERFDSSLSFGLGWGGDTLEVFPDGRIWFSATRWSDTEEMLVRLPGVCELTVLDK
jgi:hypothetical protein